MKTFKDITIGDVVVVYDEYSHDYNEHTIEVLTVEYDEDFMTETNPEGMHFYGDDLEEDEWGDDYVTQVHEGNFVCFADDIDRLEIR